MLNIGCEQLKRIQTTDISEALSIEHDRGGSEGYSGFSTCVEQFQVGIFCQVARHIEWAAYGLVYIAMETS